MTWGFVTMCNYRSLQLEGGWLNLLLLIANLGLTQSRAVQCPHWKGTAVAPSPCWRGTLLEQQHQHPRGIKCCFLISGKGKSAELRKARNSSCVCAVTAAEGEWAGLISQLTNSAGFAVSVDKTQWKDRRNQDNASLFLFCFYFFILASYLTLEEQKSVLFAQFLKLSEPIFYYMTDI